MRIRVNAGETFFGIARKFDVNQWDLLSSNPDLKNPSKLAAGQELEVPEKDERTQDVFTERPGAPKGKQLVERLLEVANREVEAKIRERGDNAGPITRYTFGVSGRKWCAMFASWVFAKAGRPVVVENNWLVAELKAAVEKLGQWKGPADLEPGMLVTYKKFSHVEIVEKPEIKNGELVGYWTIGGNTKPKGARGPEGVVRQLRPLAEIEGGGYPVKM